METAANIAETEAKPEDFESEKKEQMRLRNWWKENPEEETNISNDTLKPVQERGEGKQKIRKKQPEEHKNKMVETGNKIDDAQEIIRQQELDEPERCEKESKNQEVVKSKINDEEKDEKEIAETETNEQEKIQELAEEKTDFLKNGKVKEEVEETAEKNDDHQISRRVGDTEQRDSDAKKDIDAEMGEEFTPNIAEAEKKADEVDKIHELVEKKEEEDKKNGKVGAHSEDISSIKPEEIGEHEKVEELVEVKTPEAETNMANDTLKPVQERCEGKEKVQKLIQEETKKQPEEYKDKMVETEKKIDDAGSRKVQEIIRQQDLDEPERCERESKTQELMNIKTNDEEKDEKEIEETETKEQESYRPKILREEETAEKKTEFGDDDHQVSRRVGDTKEIDSDSKEEVDAEMDKGFKPKLAETETKAEFESQKLKLVEKKEEEEDNSKKRGQSEDSNLIKKLHETKEQQFQAQKRHNKQDKIKELVEEKTIANDVPKPVQEEAKEEFDPEMGEGSIPNISGTEKKGDEFESDTVKAVEEEDRIHELVEKKKKKKEENDKVRRQSEDTGLKRLQEEKSQGPNHHNKEEKTNELVEEKPVQATERPEMSMSETCKDKAFAETETKDQESYRPKILEGEDKIQEKAEKKKEETAEKKTELGDDDMSRKAGDIDATKPQEEKEKIQVLVLEEKVSDGGRKIVAEGKAENDLSRKVQEIDEQVSHEDEQRGSQFQKLTGEETSGQGEVKGVESEKKMTDVDKRFREAQEIVRTDSDVYGKYGKRDTFQELQEEEKDDKTDGPERRTGTIEQELVNLNSQMKQEAGGKTQELVDEEINNGKEEESDTKTDDVIRKVPGTKEQELFEPKRNHGSKIEEVKEEKIAEPEIEDECGGLSKVEGSEEQESHEPNIDKERYKTNITGTEEPSGQEKEDMVREKVAESMRITEKENSPIAQEIKDQRPDEESHENQYKIHELVEAGHNDHKEEPKDEKLTVKAKQETEEETSKGDHETEQQESDGISTSSTRQEARNRGKEINRAEERRTKTEDVSLRKVQYDEDPEMRKPYKRQEEDKIQEPVEMGTKEATAKAGHSDHKEEPKDEKLTVKAKQETEEETSKGDHETEQQESDGINLLEEERYEEVAQTETKGEHEINKEVEKNQSEEEMGDPMRKTQELVDEEINNGKEEESDTKTDDVIRKVPEPEIEDECGGLSKVEGSEEQESHEPNIDKERYKTNITGTEEPSGQEKEDMVREKVAESMRITEKENSPIAQEIKDQRPDEESHENQYKIHELVEAGHNDHKEEPKDEKLTVKAKQETEEETSKGDHETEQQESDGISTSLVQDKKQETEEKEINRAEERRTKTEDVSLRKVQYDEDPEMRKPYKRQEEDKIQEPVEMGTSDYKEKVKKQDGQDSSRSQEPGKPNLDELERHGEQTNIPQGEDEIHEPVGMRTHDYSEKVKKQDRDVEEEKVEYMAELEEKVEDDSSDKFHEFGKRKSYKDWTHETREKSEDPELSRHKTKRHENEDRIHELVETDTSDQREKLKKEDEDDRKIHQSAEAEDAVNKKEEKNLVDDATTTIQETENEESHESEKLDIVQDFVEDKTWDQEDESVGEAAAAVATNEKDGEQEEIPATSDPRVKEDGDRVAEKETEMEKVHVQEPEGKTENLKYRDEESRRGQKGKQEKNDETRSDDGIVRKFGETKVQESDEKKDQEPEEKIEEPVRKEASNDGSKLETVEDSLIKGQEFLEKESSKRRPVGQENIQQLKGAEKQEDEVKPDAGVEMQAKIKEEKGIEGSEKVAEVEMQAKIGIRMKDQETKRQELFEILEDEEHDKIPEPVVEGTKYQREKEKRVEDREAEEMKRKSEDVSSREVQKIKEKEEEGLEKHRDLSGFKENQSVKEEEVDEAGGCKAMLKTKSMEDSKQSHDVEEKGLDQTERYAEQEELMAEEEEEEQSKKEKRMPLVDSKANDDRSRKNEAERLRAQKQHKDHQDVVEMEASDQSKEEREEKTVGEEVTRDEYDSSRKNHESEDEQSDKLERHGEQEMSVFLAKEETSNDKEENRGNRAEAETTIKDNKKQLNVENYTSGKEKENMNQEAESRDDSSRKTGENEKQDSHGQKRYDWEQDKKNMAPDYCRNDEDGKEEKEIAEAEGTRKSKEIEKQEETKMVESNDCQDNITDLVEEKMNNQEKEDNESLAKSKEPERVRKQDNSKELVQQRSTDNLQDDETKVKDNESRKTRQLIEKETGEEERRKEKENRETECEGGSSKKIKEIDKEGSSEPGRDEERDKIKPVDSETSEDEDEEEELEVEVEDSEEDWEAEVIQEMDSDEDNDKLRQIRRIKLGFRLVGGSTLFMSLIVIVISIIRSKKKTRCYKF
ncbi:hypothetical protein Bca52824_025009 [Brassica carinata]|uniref:Uncharacterized protein n=1 Tax=Brassica carinata TaxID=52824 RepID=A0A8X8AXD3_BRACI|nr:hypothetical protein Bca52824_025009 [Brassica carinata]